MRHPHDEDFVAQSSCAATNKRRSKSQTASSSWTKGRIEQIGSPDDVYETPATAFVHGFIGESIAQVEGGAIRLGDRPLRLAADGLAPGASRLFVRRHDMLVGPPGSGAFEGTVRHVRNFGPAQRAEVALSGGETIVRR